MGKIKDFFGNKWVGFISASLLYTLWFVVWTQSLWMLLGLVLIYDFYISKLFYKYVWHYNTDFCKSSSIYKSIYEWVNAIVFGTVVATILHTYIFQIYVIPSSSMEKSLLVGDYLYVSKLSYGPKMPNTPVSMPLVHHTMPFSTTKKSFSEIIKLPYKRLAGPSQIERGDIVVFNFPAGDTVLVENQGVTYYDVLRSYQSAFGEKEGRNRLQNEYTIISRPVDKREHYVKRCVAVAGDTLEVIDSQLFVNGEKFDGVDGVQFNYRVQTSAPIPASVFENLNISEGSGNGSIYELPLTTESAAQLKKLPYVLDVEQLIWSSPNPDIFPSDDQYHWSVDNFGKLWVPQKGATVELTLENLPLYRRIIDIYEANDLEVRDNVIYINGKAADSYTFNMNYYWMMGDNRHNSADSRFWGFVPEDHIVGKPLFVWLSLDAAKSFPANIRMDRILKGVK